MPYLFKLYHPKSKYCFHLPEEANPDSIPTEYYLADKYAYKRVKAAQTPLSQLTWFVNRDFNDDEEAEMYESLSDDDYFFNQVRHKVSIYMQQLQSKWFDLLKSSKKTVEVHLFARSPLQQRKEYTFGNSLEANLQIFFPAGLIEKLLDASHHRTYIPPSLEMQPEMDLLFGLDFLLFPWRSGLNQEPPRQFTDQWMFWLWTLRNQGLARFASLETGAGLEMNTKKISQFLEKILQRLISSIENGDLNGASLPQLMRSHQRHVYQFAPQLMLHALSVYYQKDQPPHLKNPIRSLRSSSTFYDEHVITKAFVYARKIDFERFLAYLTLPAGDSPPMIKEELLRKLNGMLRRLDGKSSVVSEMLLSKKYTIHFNFMEKREKGKGTVLEGIRIKGDFSVLDRFHFLAEQWS